MKRRKITIIGAGNVGGTTAQRLIEKELAEELILVDINKDVALGKALDLAESAPIYGYDTQIRGTDNYADLEGSDLVIITSGVPRKPGMSRDDLLSTNAKIVKTVAQKVAVHSPEAVIIVVSNPLDAMAYVTYKTTQFPRERVIGMAGVLDSARMATFIAQELRVSSETVRAIVMGGHGDSMIPLPRYTTVGGVSVTKLIPKERLDVIVQRTRDGGAEIVKLLKTGSAYYAPSAAIVEMVESIVKDKKKILPCAALCKGEYGVQNLFVGVPAKLGHGGIESIVEFELTSEETAGLRKSSEGVKELCADVDRMIG
ncbi:MAG TPA: malate dehydrogenase [Nitrospiria bacterium]|nr:malate dehydrogenase [Nitrospiria bacterium]